MIMDFSNDGLRKIADNPLEDGRLTHLKIKLGSRIPELFFLPGDPARMEVFRKFADKFEYINENREFKTAVGEYHGRKFGVCSTGIGGGSAEIAVSELYMAGARKLVRVGGCGAIQENIDCGDVIINTGMVRLGGSSSFYVRPEFPAVADPFMVCAIAESAGKEGIKYHVGIGATINSYYAGQNRPLEGKNIFMGEKLFEEMTRAKVLNYDMETETIFTLSSLYGISAANILAVHGNRISNLWMTDYRKAQENVVKIALNASI
jgi:uridine phosphorylase